MANRRRTLLEATQLWSRLLAEIGDQFREARLALGLTQQQVAAALGVSRSQICRVELGKLRTVSAEFIMRHAAVIGLRPSIKLYPRGGGLRDAGQARYIARFVGRIGHAWRAELDVPIPIPGDLRAVDVLLTGGGLRIAVEVITRLRDLQAQLRAAHQKGRDIGADRVILVIAGTPANRRVLAEARPTVLASYELDTRYVLGALAAGRDPGRDAIITI